MVEVVRGCEAVAAQDSSCAPANRFHSVRAIAPGPGASECGSIPENSPEFSSKISRHGGARANSGGARPNSGGARPGAGRKPKVRRQPWAEAPRVEGGAWYGVRFDPGCDLLTVNRLMASGVEVLLPVHQPDPSRPPVLALGCYLFARFDVTVPSWRKIPGVLRECRARLLGEDGEHPRPIPDAQVEALRRALEGEAAPKVAKLRRLVAGERVRVVGGLLGAEVGEGVVEWASGREARVSFGGPGLVVARSLLEPVG